MKSTSLFKILFSILAIFLFAFAGIFFVSDSEKVINMVNQKVAPVLAEPEEVFDPTILKWELITAEAPFAKRDSHSVVVFKGKFWLLGGVGGTAPIYKPNYNDIWTSENGQDWTLVLESAPWAGRRSQGVVIFQDKMWIFGGVTDGDVYLNDVWSSTDGINWQEVTDNAQWSPRKGFSSVVFQNKIWVMGGIDSKNAENDVWYSENGKDWTLAVKNAEWSPRLGLITEVFDNKIWMTGGNFPDEMGQQDVWNSEDGVKWNFVTNAPWPGRHCHCLVSYNNYLWVIGGWSGYGHGYNDVWYSKDGITWEKLYGDGDSPWKGREDLTCTEFNGEIYMMGGMKSSGARTNDVWVLNKN